NRRIHLPRSGKWLAREQNRRIHLPRSGKWLAREQNMYVLLEEKLIKILEMFTNSLTLQQ
ncbi:MAG: hypothetical protein MJY58_08250, partial [Bacteroidaceae bacterium]|nr:hypothetical protein [Bacteroidaceae bacterium]